MADQGLRLSTPKPQKTLWWCERCHASGVIELDPPYSVSDAVRLLTVNHDRNALACYQQCVFETRRVRVQMMEKL